MRTSARFLITAVFAVVVGGLTTAPTAGAAVVDVDPTIQTSLCGIGVGVAGIGTTGSCAGVTPPAPAPAPSPLHASAPHPSGPHPSGVDISPNLRVDACGIGVGVLGVGTTSDCKGRAAQAPAATPTAPAAVRVAPTASADACGIGVGVAGIGTTANCTTSAASAAPAPDATDPHDGPGADAPGADATPTPARDPHDAADSAGTDVAGTTTFPARLASLVDPVADAAGASLPFTGGTPLSLLVVAAAAIGTGAVLRRRRCTL
jgi:hypothetical protein